MFFDVDWDTAARQDTALQRQHSRERWQAETIVFNGKEEKRHRVLQLLRGPIMSAWEEAGRDVSPVTEAIIKAKAVPEYGTVDLKQERDN